MRILLTLVTMGLLTSCAFTSSTATIVPPIVTEARTVATPYSLPVTGTSTPTVLSKPTIWYTPSPHSTMPLSFVTLIPIYLEHWKEYEQALAKELERMTPPEKVLCEWVILGQSEQAVYVWALCAEHEQNDIYPYPGVSEPAAVYISPEGEVVGVKVPEPGGPFARDIFPEDVQEKIFRAHNGGWLDVSQLQAHLIYRFEHPEVPPLVVLSATPAP